MKVTTPDGRSAAAQHAKCDSVDRAAKQKRRRCEQKQTQGDRNALAAVQWKEKLFATKSTPDRHGRLEMARLHAAALRLAFTSALSERLGSRAQLRGLAGDIVERVAHNVRPSQLGLALGRVGDCLSLRSEKLRFVIRCDEVYAGPPRHAFSNDTVAAIGDLKLEARRLKDVALTTARVDSTRMDVVRQQDLSACHALCRASLEHYSIKWEGPRSDWHDWYDFRTARDTLSMRDMFDIERVFKAVAQVAQEVSVVRHELLGDAHAESRESAASLSTMEVLLVQLLDAELVANDYWDTHDDPRGKLDVVHMNWEALSVEQSAAAIRLGWTTATWDANQLTLVEGPRCEACGAPERRDDRLDGDVCSECRGEWEQQMRLEASEAGDGYGDEPYRPFGCWSD